MIAFLALALLAAPAQRVCSLDDPAACGGLYELSGAPGFERAVRQFVGPGRATWYEPNGDRTEQLLAIFEGPSSDWKAIGPDLLRFEACYPQVCNIRGALFISKSGEIKGAALLYPNCSDGPCSGDEDLKVTILRHPRYPDVVRFAREWAKQDVAQMRATFVYSDDRIDAVEIVTARGGHAPK